jgi:hypothetical protein
MVPRMRQPLLSLLVPPIVLLAGTVIGIVTMQREFHGNWMAPLGHVQMLSVWDIVERCGVAWLAIMVAASVCAIPRVSRGLALFAFSGPALLLLYGTRTLVLTIQTEPVIWKAWGLSLMLFVLLVLGWFALLNWSQVRERMQARMGHALMASVLRLDTPGAIQQALILADSWIDPLGHGHRLWHRLAAAHTLPERQHALQSFRDRLEHHTPFLDAATHHALTGLVPEKPEAGLLLAIDAAHRKEHERARAWLEHMAQTVLDQFSPAWLLDQALTVVTTSPSMRTLSPDIRYTLQAVKLVVTFAHAKPDRQRALTHACAALVQQQITLPASCQVALRDLAMDRPEALLLLADDAFQQQRLGAGYQLLAHLLHMLAPDTAWLVAATQSSWNHNVPASDAQVQSDLWELVCAQHDPDSSALTALAMIGLTQGLASDVQHAVAGGTQPAAVLLHACHLFSCGNDQAALPGLCRSMTVIPEVLHHTLLLPRLHAAAVQMDLVRQTSFFTRHARPQLLEMHAVPLTSIYGSRISCWLFTDNHRQPQRFMVTGHGPSSICARVSSILYTLAYERNCPSDMLLAGFSTFDLTAPAEAVQPRTHWSSEQLMQQVVQRVEQLQVQAAWQKFLHDPHQAHFFAQFIRQQVQPTVHTAREELQRIEADMGFVVNQHRSIADYRQAEALLQQGEAPDTSVSFPVLRPYQYGDTLLRLQLPRFCLGGSDYEQITSVYRRSVHQDMQQEWARRCRKYEEWAHQFAHTFRRLHQLQQQHGPSFLSTQTMYIHFNIDPTTATEVPLDPPMPTSELDYLAKLPSMLVQQLAYWAWADHKITELSEQAGFAPPWEQSTLIDAFLRDWPLPTDNEDLNTARDAWQAHWRPLALVTLEQCLQDVGLTLADIAVENTVFRVVADDGDYLTLELWHIFDPHYDAPPTTRAQISLFAPRFGKRSCAMQDARMAEQHAVATLRHALAAQPVPTGEVQSALLRDSGAALDQVIDALWSPLDMPDLEAEIARVVQDAGSRLDPVVAFGLPRRRRERTTIASQFSLARSSVHHGTAQHPYIPDFDAWGLYIIGACIGATAKNIQEQIRRTDPLPFRSPFAAEPALPEGMEQTCIETLATAHPWHVLTEYIEGRSCAATITAVLTWIDAPDIGNLMRETYQRLRQRDPAYMDQCFASTEVPPASSQRTALAAPGCFTGWERVCYAIAEGDMALQLAWSMRRGTAALQHARLQEMMRDVQHIAVPPTFDRLTTLYDQVLTDLNRYQAQTNRVSMGFAAGALQQRIMDCIAIAESSYHYAACADGNYGVGWLRLARLKWMTGQFREALMVLTGPRAAVNLNACRLPLGVAVRVAGGTLTVDYSQPLAEGALAGLELTVTQTQDRLELACAAGQCCITGLSAADMDMLTALFRKYQPAMLQSAGPASFDAWIRLVQVPGLGQRAAIAQALQGEAAFAWLAAAVYLGVPDVLQVDPSSTVPAYRRTLLDHDVIVNITW